MVSDPGINAGPATCLKPSPRPSRAVSVFDKTERQSDRWLVFLRLWSVIFGLMIAARRQRVRARPRRQICLPLGSNMRRPLLRMAPTLTVLVLALTSTGPALHSSPKQAVVVPSPRPAVSQPELGPADSRISPARANASHAIDYCLNNAEASVPSTARLVSVSERDQLQSLLDQYRSVRLQAGDYHGALTAITLRSGQALFGVPRDYLDRGSFLPRIVVPGGTTNVILYGVQPDALRFEAGAVTSSNCFASIRRCPAGLTSAGASLESNVFLDIADCPLKVDNHGNGYLRNNRFIRVKVQSTWPQIEIKGDPQRTSSGNVILWHNDLVPNGGRGIYIDNQADLAIVGMDAESWNLRNEDPTSALLTAGPMGTLRLASIVVEAQIASQPTPIFDIAADELQAYATDIYNTATPAMTLQKTNQRAAIIRDYAQLSPLADMASTPVRFRAFPGLAYKATVGGHDVTTTSLTGSELSALQRMFVAPASARGGQPWERPSFLPIPDPVSSNPGDPNRDDTNYIQHLIDSHGVAQLPAGTYYISRPLSINSGHGLQGAGAATTAIVAKSPSIDLIISRDHIGPSPGQPIRSVASNDSIASLTLTDVTLQGGRNGIHHEPKSAGGLATYSSMYVSHVTFRDMAEAGIFIDHILGWDNNWFDFLNFYHNGAGIKERGEFVWDPHAPAELPYWGYLDKNVFYHNQFVGNGLALDLQAARQSNSNMWINSLFQDNRAVLDQSNVVGTVFANSDFINNGGNPTLRTDRFLTCVSCYFRADARGSAMLGTDVMVNSAAAQCEGCIFEMGSSTNAHLASGGKLFLYNTRSADMPVGSVDSGLFLNNALTRNPSLSQPGVFVKAGTPYTFLPGNSNPVPQLLYGVAFLPAAPGAEPRMQEKRE